MLDMISKIIAAFNNPVVTPIASEINNADVIVMINQLLKSFNNCYFTPFCIKSNFY